MRSIPQKLGNTDDRIYIFSCATSVMTFGSSGRAIRNLLVPVAIDRNNSWLTTNSTVSWSAQLRISLRKLFW